MVGLAVPSVGQALANGISPLLALLISLTFDVGAVRLVFARPSRQVLALVLVLVYAPMSLAGLITGRLFFGTGPLATGQTLVGTLPTDVSAPLLVLLARGNVALAAVLNAVKTALSPFIVPALSRADRRRVAGSGRSRDRRPGCHGAPAHGRRGMAAYALPGAGGPFRPSQLRWWVVGLSDALARRARPQRHEHPRYGWYALLIAAPAGRLTLVGLPLLTTGVRA